MADDKGLGSPAFIIAVAILGGVFILIGAAILGIDNGVLASMSRTEFARGLITYLFAVVTIGTAVVLVVSVLTSEHTEENEKRFSKGKEILSLLLGVFGTIVGFYFGSAVKGDNAEAALALALTKPLVAPLEIASGKEVHVTVAVTGGAPPYRYGLDLGKAEKPVPSQSVREDGWIVEDMTAPRVEGRQKVPLRVVVRDSNGAEESAFAMVTVSP